MARFYYATMLEGEYTNEKYAEPIARQTAHGGDVGKNPEYCCDALLESCSFSLKDVFMIGRNRKGDPSITVVSGDELKTINFCPFCGEKIEWLPNLKIKAERYKIQDFMTRVVVVD